jgi:hypothetical protein
MINYARSQDGVLSNPEYIASFSLGASDSDRIANGRFGQASCDRSQTLYVTETSSSDARVWAVPVSELGGLNDAATVSYRGPERVSGDKGGTGVTARDGAVYAYFDDGGIVTDPVSRVSYAGPRLRKGTPSSFPGGTGSLIIGESSSSANKTLLAKYGCLAIDMDTNVYLARHLADSGTSGNSILFYSRGGQFAGNQGLNGAPNRTFATVNNLRVIAHAVKKDWLAGAVSVADAGRDTLWMWQDVSLAPSPPSRQTFLGSGISIRGLALDSGD